MGKKNYPKVSIIIPVFNGASYLWQTIESIQKSTYKNFEIILVDDGSTDESKKICKKIRKKYNNIRFYQFKKNKGLTSVLNYAIKKAKGKYIARINQDDIMTPKRLEKQVKFLEKHPQYVAVGSNIILIDKNNQIIDKISFPKTDKDIRKQWLFLSPFSDPSVMYRKDGYFKTKGYQKYFWPADDVHMWYQLGKIGKLANLNETLTLVRWHNKTGSILFHRIQIKKTFLVHIWASKNVEKAKFYHWLFWIAQLILGMIFPPQLNWFIYRKIRRIQNVLNSFRNFKRNNKTERVIPHPKILSFSGQ